MHQLLDLLHTMLTIMMKMRVHSTWWTLLGCKNRLINVVVSVELINVTYVEEGAKLASKLEVCKHWVKELRLEKVTNVGRSKDGDKEE